MKRLIKQRLRRQVVVTLKTGDSFSGVLFEVDSESFVLRKAEALGMAAKGENLTVDGELLVLRADIAYIQLP